MKLTILNDDNTVSEHIITKVNSQNNSLKNKVGYVNSKSKEKNALDITTAYYSNSKIILYDDSNKIIANKLEELNINEFKSNTQSETIFDDKDFSMMFFTSGTTGVSVGALKTKENLYKEVEVFTKLIEKYKIKRVILTVPFIHIYGVLVGLLYPLLNDIEIVLKEHFLPHNLLDIIDDNSLVVTTPLYIKALSKISDEKDLNKSLFISSTAPLDNDICNNFRNKYNTNVMQLFGSTETGGIAYKLNDSELWTPMNKVDISVNSETQMIVLSPFVSKCLYQDEFKNIDGIMETFDYIEKVDSQFRLIGRSSKILKIAGKRYSTIEIENILEDIDSISKAVVFVSRDKNSLRGETLDITLETKDIFSSLDIKKILKSKISNLKFSIVLTIIEKLQTNQIGKILKVT